MNIATGTFGTGIPEDCPNCKKLLDYELISPGWNAKKTKTKKKERMDSPEIYDSWYEGKV